MAVGGVVGKRVGDAVGGLVGSASVGAFVGFSVGVTEIVWVVTPVGVRASSTGVEVVESGGIPKASSSPPWQLNSSVAMITMKMPRLAFRLEMIL